MRRIPLVLLLTLSATLLGSAHADERTVEWRRTASYRQTAGIAAIEPSFTLLGDEESVAMTLHDASGLDVAAEYEIYDQLGNLRAAGSLCGRASEIRVPIDAHALTVRSSAPGELCAPMTVGTVTISFRRPVHRPYFSGLSTSRAARGSQNVEVQIWGWNLDPETHVVVSGTGVRIEVVDVNRTYTESRIIARLSIDADAEIGARDVVVSNGPGLEALCVACLEVTERPTIASVSPAEGPIGRTTVVTIRGSSFASGAWVRVEGILGEGTDLGVNPLGPPDIFVGPTNVVDAETITVRLSPQLTAMMGPRTIVVVNQDGGLARCPGCFTVLPV